LNRIVRYHNNCGIEHFCPANGNLAVYQPVINSYRQNHRLLSSNELAYYTTFSENVKRAKANASIPMRSSLPLDWSGLSPGTNASNRRFADFSPPHAATDTFHRSMAGVSHHRRHCGKPTRISPASTVPAVCDVLSGRIRTLRSIVPKVRDQGRQNVGGVSRGNEAAGRLSQQPVVFVDFLHIHAKNPDYPACFRSLQGIKIHFREFLYGFMRETQQTPRRTEPWSR
jgi:hypothetical protein